MSDERQPGQDGEEHWDKGDAAWVAQQGLGGSDAGSGGGSGGFREGFVDALEAAGDGVLDAGQAVIDVFTPERVEAQVPDLSDVPMSPEETTMRSSSVAHDDAPPEPRP